MFNQATHEWHVGDSVETLYYTEGDSALFVMGKIVEIDVTALHPRFRVDMPSPGWLWPPCVAWRWRGELWPHRRSDD
jgi:hypothetical protein